MVLVELAILVGVLLCVIYFAVAPRPPKGKR